MVNLKKYNDVLKLFVIFLTLFFTTSSKVKRKDYAKPFEKLNKRHL
jgi:hypothetical protein